MISPKSVVSLLLALSLFGQSFPALLFTTHAQDASSLEIQIEELGQLLDGRRNGILEAKYAMLQHKADVDEINEPYRSFAPTGLQQEMEQRSFGMFGEDTGAFSEGLHVLTGGRAVDESLQLGSIGVGGDDPDARVQHVIENLLEIYYDDHGEFPASLQDITKDEWDHDRGTQVGNERVLLKDVIDRFHYSKEPITYEPFVPEKSATSDYCTDSDGGLNYFEKGEIGGVEDSCKYSDTVIELYCMEPTNETLSVEEMHRKNSLVSIELDVGGTFKVGGYTIQLFQKTENAVVLKVNGVIIPTKLEQPVVFKNIGILASSDVVDVTYEGRTHIDVIDRYLAEKEWECPEDCTDGACTRKQETYTLELKDKNLEVSLEEVSGVDLKSHDWAAMLGGEQVEVMPIAEVVPEDSFFLYFSDVEVFNQLEETLQNLVDPIQGMFAANIQVAIKQAVFERFGIEKVEETMAKIEEAAFISEDFDFLNNNTFALILKLKEGEEILASNQVEDSQLNGYTILTHSPKYMQKITRSWTEGTTLMKAMDFQYTLLQLESRREGLMYFSEDLIKKLTSPGYRTKSERRNSMMHAVMSLQYLSFAYRSITGLWARDFQQIADEGYISIGGIQDIKEFTIDADGIVSHSVWGSIYAPTPIDEVDITHITSAEKRRYELFSEGYQDYWTEFIDPVGVAITVGDHIMFHTVILPLIEESSYNALKYIFGNNQGALRFVSSPDRFPSIQIAGNFDVDEIVYRIKVESMKAGMNEEQQNALESNPQRDQILGEARKTVADFLNLPAEEDPFAFIGNEVMVGIGQKIAFEVQNLQNFDVWIGFALDDQVKAKEFFDAIWRKFAEDVDLSSMGPMMLFQVSDEGVLSNVYNDVEYYILPTGFINLYYTFINNRVYFAISQTTINKLIDSVKTAQEENNNNVLLERTLEYIGQEHNFMVLAALNNMEEWKKQFFTAMYVNSINGSFDTSWQVIYADEAFTLAQTFDDPVIDLTKAKEYYPNIAIAPMRIYVKEGQLYAEGFGKNEPLFQDDNTEQVEGEEYQGLNILKGARSNVRDEADLQFEALVEENYQKAWEAFQTFGVGFTFTEHGLDIRVAFNNPNPDVPKDSRFSAQKEERPIQIGTGTYQQYMYIALGVGVLIVVIIGGLIVLRLRRKNGGK